MFQMKSDIRLYNKHSIVDSKHLPDYSGFSNIEDGIKFLAIILMFIDHIAMFFFPKVYICRTVGRMVMPVFCFFAGYNATKIRPKVLFVGILVSCMYSFLCNDIFYIDIIQVELVFMIFVGQCLIVLLTRYKCGVSLILALGLILTLICFESFLRIHIQYSTISLSFMLCGFIARKNDQSYKYLLAFNLVYFLFFSQKSFNFHLNTYLLVIEFISLYLLFMLDFNKIIRFNCKIISRNSLTIYWVHLYLLKALRSCYI